MKAKKLIKSFCGGCKRTHPVLPAAVHPSREGIYTRRPLKVFSRIPLPWRGAPEGRGGLDQSKVFWGSRGRFFKKAPWPPEARIK